MLIEFLGEINEGRAEKGRGSKAGREKFSSKKGTKGSSVKARKSRVKIFNTIEDALNSAIPYGTIFSTKNADRLYVVSKAGWGEKSKGRIAKGFTPGAATPSASWPSIKAHAVRTGLKHGGSKSKRLKAKYGSGSKRPEEKRYAGKKPVKEGHCPGKSGKLAEILPLLTLIKRVLLKREGTMHEFNTSVGSQVDQETIQAKKFPMSHQEKERTRKRFAQDKTMQAKVRGSYQRPGVPNV